MAGTKVKNGVCSACGVEVRPNAEFCYNCGKEVSLSVVVEEETAGTSDICLKEDIQEDGADVEGAPVDKDVESNSSETKENSEKDLEADDSKTKEEETEIKADDPIPKPIDGNDEQMKTAAALREKPRNRMVKQEEIVWEEYDKSPNFLLLGVAIAIVLGVLALFYISMYLR